MSISLIIDLALCLISIILIIRYTCKGAVRSILSYAKVFLAIGLAFALRNPVATLLNKMFMTDSVTDWVHNSLMASASGTETNGLNIVELYQNTPSFFTNVLSKFGIDLTDFDAAIEALPYASEEQIAELSANIGGSIALMLSTILAVVIVFALAIIVLTVIINLIDKAVKLPGLNLVNRVLGAVIGALISITIIWAVSGIATLVVNYVGPIAPETINQDIIDNSVILKMLKDSQLTEKILSYIQ